MSEIKSARDLGSVPIKDMTVGDLYFALQRFGQQYWREASNWCPPPEDIPGAYKEDA